jgi:hypothetical protein
VQRAPSSIAVPERALWIALPCVVASLSCASTEVKGRETLRVAPLRQMVVVPQTTERSSPLLDAGTNVLTDDELAALVTELPDFLARGFAREESTGSATWGAARVVSCRVDAGAGRAHTVYEARCRVQLLVGGEPVAEVHSQAVRRVRARAISEDEAKEIVQLERNPLLEVDDTRAALESCLAAAAQLLSGRPLEPTTTGFRLATVPFAERRRLALLRYHRAHGGDGGGDDVRAALHDLAHAGLAEDAALIARSLERKAPAEVTVDELDALGLLCDPAFHPLAAQIASSSEVSAVVRKAAAQAARRMQACATLTRGQRCIAGDTC